MAKLNSCSRRLTCQVTIVAVVVGIGLTVWAASDVTRRDADLSTLFDNTRHNFGAVHVGPDLMCRFRLTNTTDHPITVEKVRASCGCLAHQIDTSPAAPGESRVLDFVLKTSGFRPPHRLEKTVLVDLLAAGKTRRLPLTISANLRGDIAIEPSELVFDRRALLARKPIVVTIRRDMISARDFGTLHVMGHKSHYWIEETLRTEDVVKLAVHRSANHLTAYPRPIEVRFVSCGSTKATLLPVSTQVSDAGVQLVPSSYMASFTKGIGQEALRHQTSQDFELVSHDEGTISINKIEAGGLSAESPFQWKISPRDPHRFRVWTRGSTFEDQIASAVLEIFYSHTRGDRTVRGTIPLGAHLVAIGAGDGNLN